MKLDKLAFIEALSLFSEVSSDKVECVVNLLTKIEDDYLSTVKSEKQNIVIPAENVMKIKCRVKIEELETPVPAMFEPDELQDWLEELQINEKLLTVHPGQRRITLHINNTSRHDVMLRGDTVLDRLELVASVTPKYVVYKGMPEETVTNTSEDTTKPVVNSVEAEQLNTERLNDDPEELSDH